MGLLEQILARSAMAVNPALMPEIVPERESILETLARGPEVTTRQIKNPFPDVVVPPGAPPLATMAPQAGLLAPNIGGLGLPMPAAEPDVPREMVPIPQERPPIDAMAAATDVDLPHGRAPRSLITPPQQEALHNAAPTLTPPPPRPTTAVPSSPFGSSPIWDRLTSALGNRSNTLLALAAGFAGAPTIGQGISRAAAAAIPARAADTREQLLHQGQSATTAALLQAGVPLQMAIAAQANPEIMKSVHERYLAGRKAEIKEIKTEDAFGNKSTRLVGIDPYTLKTTDLDGARHGGGGASPPAGATMFAPGVTEVDHAKVGDEYLGQFSPEVQAGVKAYLRGDSLPTGRQQLAQTIKTIAQKYGDDIGMPANDQLYSQRKIFANSLGDTKSGVGMQSKGFQQGLQHMAQLSDKLVKAGNVNLGLEGVSKGVNWMRNLTTGQQDVIRGIQTDAHLLAGETGKLFSGSSGGGVREREEMAGRFGDPTMSGPAAAGALESALEAMEGGLLPLRNRRDELFPGAEKPRGSNFLGPAEQAAIDKIRKNIAILRGEEKAAASPAAKTVPPGKYIWTPDRGLVPQ